MTASLNLLLLAALAAFLCSLSPALALANPAANAHALANVNHARHNELAAKHKRASTCKPRPTSTSHPAPSSSPAPPKSTPSTAPKANTASSGGSNSGGSNSGGSNSGVSGSNTGSPGKSGGSGKKGLAWDNGGTDALFQNFNLPQISAMYTWTPDCPSQASQVHYPCYPMLWDATPGKVSAFNQVASRLDSEWYMGFNECNEPGQCNCSPGEAASVWKSTLAPLRNNHGKKIVCPVTSSNPNGFTWVQNFFSSCNGGCDCDALALHFYDTTADKFKAYVEKWHNEWPNIPIWVTEFNFVNFNNDGQPQPSYSQVQSAFAEVVSWMEAPEQSYIQKYFAFGMSDPPGGGLESYCGLVNSDLQLNALGWTVFGT